MFFGETRKNLRKHLTEHKAAVRRGNRNNGIAVHSWDHDHRVELEAARVLEHEPPLILEEIDTGSNPHNETQQYH